MRLSELIAGLNCRVYNFKDIRIEELTCDSRRVAPGSLFIAVKGNKYDGHEFVKDAERSGAVAIATQKKVTSSLPQIVFKDTREMMGKIARNFYGDFSELMIVGVTGTNGKTTTTFLIHSILNRAGLAPGLIGTIYYMGNEKVKAERTTPESLELFKLIDRFRKGGMKSIVMEVSSHALALKRVEELRFRVAIFTNLSQDHLDFHKTMAEYKKAKLHLFDLLSKEGIAVYNLDDPVAEEIQRLYLPCSLNYGFSNGAMIKGEIVEDNLSGLRMNILHKDKKLDINSKLVGTFNGYNILASFAAGVALNIDYGIIKEGIESLKNVPGRMEHVAENIFVDFAHTPGAIGNLLNSLRKYTTGRLIIIFGCGGDRDKEKRPQMGAIASENADLVILTSDNPRTEEPEEIIKDIVSGIKKNNFIIIPDRREAIEYGIKIKKAEDILVIAGKGHEEYQIVKDKIIPFDDTQVVRETLGVHDHVH
ncbi:MAG: UDP-N-acetylmuramoyl-L-alanyl-D-glutamate--2,6-diaminopimelate ligase [candidate division WOR-3 bacterium]|nr:UDP-N-acetylmuramoyl-L-alanyl-D-glutamate--2,6-diaminopimelate ligase [candidate division WOR-3 bacterium]